MLFVDPLFLVFLVIVLLAYWSVRSNTWRKVFLLTVSFIFYGFWDWRLSGCCCSRQVSISWLAPP